mmetsp:Transcript_85755/g.195493  ORF Transcript_85755/g.195493 Transcript_85755/m.195493 type:complete len:273 (+) Transcript_85755:1007-1825(+)
MAGALTAERQKIQLTNRWVAGRVVEELAAAGHRETAAEASGAVAQADAALSQAALRDAREGMVVMGDVLARERLRMGETQRRVEERLQEDVKSARQDSEQERQRRQELELMWQLSLRDQQTDLEKLCSLEVQRAESACRHRTVEDSLRQQLGQAEAALAQARASLEEKGPSEQLQLEIKVCEEVKMELEVRLDLATLDAEREAQRDARDAAERRKQEAQPPPREGRRLTKELEKVAQQLEEERRTRAKAELKTVEVEQQLVLLQQAPGELSQ